MQKYRYMRIVLVLVVIMAAGVVFLYLHNRTLRTQIEELIGHNEQQTLVIDSLHRSGVIYMMGNVLKEAEEELDNSLTRTLSDERIAAIAALCYMLKPHTYKIGDSISTRKLSPERGQLLLMLASMNLDSGTLQKIMLRASFAGALLRNSNLNGAKLAGADLGGADLQGADLRSADLSGCNLRIANLWGANLSNAKLNGAELVRADLRWTNLNQADLTRADLTGADLSSAQLRNADLRDADLEAADLNGAFLNEALFKHANLFRTSWKRAIMKGVDLSETNMTYADLFEADLTDANLIRVELSGVTVAEENWLRMIKDWSVIGADEIQDKYKLVYVAGGKPPHYRLDKK